MPRPKVAVLYVGGSIGMVSNQKTGRIEPLESLFEIHRFLPEMQREVSLQFFSLANLGSSEVTSEHWMDIAKTIEEHYDEFEGFVIIHGTNTMSYTAAALSFALQNLSKPVILTGSLIPINDPASDGRSNLVFAIRAAQLDIAEVCIVLGSRILRGSRAEKTEQSILQTFESPKFPVLGEFTNAIRLNPWRIVRRKRSLVSRASFDTEVMSIMMYPGMPSRFLDAVLDMKPHGIILSAYGSGMLPESMFPWIRRVTSQKIPLVFTSQLFRGTIDLHRHRKQLTLEQLGVISGKNMTHSCAVVKLMWALAQTKSPSRIQELLEKDLVGELDE